MLKIRLQRVGRKHEPSFRLVLTESENSTKSGRFSEILGSYDPRKTTEAFKTDRIKHWLAMGAEATGTVNNLLIKKGLIRGKKTHVGQDHVVPAPKMEAPAPAIEEAAPVVVEAAVETVAETPVEAAAETPVEPTQDAEPVAEAAAETPVEAVVE